MARQLLGPDGEPIRKETLTQELAAPSITGVRQVFAPDPSVGLTPQRLAQLLRAAEECDAEEYLALAERMEEKDLHYNSVLGTRKRAVAQLDVVVEPAGETPDDEANAELVRNWLKRLSLENELFNILDAIGKGFSVSEIVWETSEKDWQPRKLCWVDPRWFEIDRIDGRTLRLRGNDGPRDLEPYKFVVHNHAAKTGLPIRGGLARIAGWAYLFKNYAVKDWVAFAEIYGQPLRVGKYPPNATPDDRRTLLRAVANIGTDAAAIIPEGMLIEFVKGDNGAGGPDLYAKLCEFLDKQVSKGVLGQTLTTEVGSEGGSRATGQVHNEVRGDIRRSDKKQLAATLTEQIARPLVELNRGPQKSYPAIKLMEPESHDPEKVVKIAGEAAKLGLRISKEDVLKKTGLKEAADDEDAIERPKELQPPGGDTGDDDAEDPSARAQDKPGSLPKKSKGKELPPKPGDRDKAAAAVCPVHGVAHAAGDARPGGKVDAVDDIVADMISESHEAVAPMLQPILDLAAECASFDEFRNRLPAVAGKMDAARIVALVGRGAFAARLEGIAREIEAADTPEPSA